MTIVVRRPHPRGPNAPLWLPVPEPRGRDSRKTFRSRLSRKRKKERKKKRKKDRKKREEDGKKGGEKERNTAEE